MRRPGRRSLQSVGLLPASRPPRDRLDAHSGSRPRGPPGQKANLIRVLEATLKHPRRGPRRPALFRPPTIKVDRRRRATRETFSALNARPTRASNALLPVPDQPDTATALEDFAVTRDALNLVLPPPGVDRLRANHLDHRPTSRHQIQHLTAELQWIALPALSLEPAWPKYPFPDSAESGADHSGLAGAVHHRPAKLLLNRKAIDLLNLLHGRTTPVYQLPVEAQGVGDHPDPAEPPVPDVMHCLADVADPPAGTGLPEQFTVVGGAEPQPCPHLGSCHRHLLERHREVRHRCLRCFGVAEEFLDALTLAAERSAPPKVRGDQLAGGRKVPLVEHLPPEAADQRLRPLDRPLSRHGRTIPFRRPGRNDCGRLCRTERREGWGSDDAADEPSVARAGVAAPLRALPHRAGGA